MEINLQENYSASEFIRQLSKLDIKLRLDGEKLRCIAPKGAVTKELLSEIEKHKKDIISVLKAEKEKDIFIKPIQKVQDSGCCPLSAAQKRMFILNQLDKNSTAYNLTQVLKIEGQFDKEQFVSIFKKIAQRHESLRTSFKIVDGEPVQVVHDDIEISAEYEEMAGIEKDIDDKIIDFIRPYDMESYPLFRLKVIKLIDPSPERNNMPVYYVLIDMHHIISDGISVSILVREINALIAGKSLPALKTSYRDYAVWHNNLLSSEIIKREREYWINELSGELPILNLPYDYQRPQKFSFKGDSIRFPIDSGLSKKLYDLARENKVTLFSVLMSAFYILLYKYTGQEDIIIGTSTAGRRHHDINDVIGVFINTLALRNFPEPQKTFRSFLKEVGENSLKAFDNQDYPFEKLVDDLEIKRDPGRNPIFDVMFILLNMDIGEVQAEGRKISYYEYKKRIAQFDILINAYESKRGIDLEIEYCTDLFKRDTIERFGAHFVKILECAAEDPDLSIGCIDMLTQKEKHQLLNVFNDTELDYPKSLTVHKLFEECAKKNPDAVALVFKDRQMTYGELNEKSDRLARMLVNKGVGKDVIVGLMVERSFDMITGILGVLKAGGAYLPVDPEFPADRINYILNDSGAKILLSTKQLYDRINDSETEHFEFIDIEDESAIDLYEDTPLPAGDPHSLAYVIYTSGSTGKPKGVMLEHRSVVNFIHGVKNRIEFGADSTILCLTTISFDIFVLETLLPLSVGMRIVIADEKEQINPRLLKKAIVNNKVNMLQITPSRLQLLLHGTSDLSCLKQLTAIMIGGEAFPQNLLTELKKHTHARIYNMYGPTETTVWSTIGELTNSDFIDIGTPIANTKVFVVDKDGNPTSVGVPGELLIAGAGLARGYLNKPELTEEKFAKVPFYEEGKVYRTGDLAKWNSSGNLEILGRMDQQVKIRGYRIELEEIERCLSNYKAVKECVVVAKSDGTGTKYLAAYYSADREIAVSDLRRHLSKDLPDYMIPAVFVFLDKLPSTPNGKIDRKALPEPDKKRPKLDTAFKRPTTDTEKQIARIWTDVLNCESVGASDNFFELGGNSLLAIKAEAIAYKQNLNFSSSDIYTYQTVEQLAAFIDGSKNSADVQSQTDIELSRQQAAATIVPKSSGKVIENIEPFNEIFYRICFYNSFFPVVIHFGKSILPFLINDTAVYAKYPKDSETGKLDIDYISAIPTERVISEEGMILQTKNFNEDILCDITAALDENKPVIVWVDCFYESIRTDQYKNKHWSHTVLIYGYDEVQKTFNIIEHSYRDSLSYKKQVISFEDIYNMTKGYMENFYSNIKQPVFYAFSENKSSVAYDKSNNRYYQIFKNNTLNNQNLIADRLECLKAFILDYDRIILDKNEFFKTGDKLIESFNMVINSKLSDKYKLETMANKNLVNVCEALNEITEMWSEVRRVTAKIFYSEIYNYDKLQRVSQELRSIYQKEKDYIELLISSLDSISR